MTEEQKASVKRGMSEWIFTGVHPGITPDPEVNCQLDHLILGTDKWDDLSNTNKHICRWEALHRRTRGVL